MTLLDRALARARPVKAEPPPSRPGRLRVNVSEEKFSIPDPARTENQVALYKKLSWIQIAVKIASQTAAATPYTVKQGDKTIPDHPFLKTPAGFYGSLQRPNPMQSRFEFLEATFAWRAAAGNCYWWLNRPDADSPPAEMWIIPAHQIQPVPDGNLGVAGYVYDPNGVKQPLEAWEVVHFKTWNPLNKYVGLSPIESLMLDSIGDIAAQQYNAAFYGKDNAKVAGILAFADYIGQDAWDQINSDWEKKGAAKSDRVIKLRGVGKGGVEWLPTQLTQAEIQYLEQRTFTKEEIYDMFAPGLSSVLSVNATEANSTAGKDTFLSMCIYPQHVAVSEKIDNDLLPVYGDDLDGEFEDVRRVDTAQELREQEAYERSHTLDEIRAKFYGDTPMGDERGTLLPKQITASSGEPSAPEVDPLALVQAGKALDRRRWRDKATKALVAGRSADVTFDPDYLTDDEAMAIRGALKRVQRAEDVTGVFEA